MPRKARFIPLPHGLGSVYEASPGRWRAALTLVQPDGRRKRVYLRGATPEAVKARALAYREDHDAETAPTTTATPLGDYLERWLKTVAEPSIRDHTRRAYRVQIARIVGGLGGHQLGRLTADHIRSWYVVLSTESGLAPGTIGLTHAVLRMALSQAVTDRIISRNPAEIVKPPRASRTERPVLTPAQLTTLLDYAESRDDRLLALWTLLAFSGVRIGEALGLRWADVDFEAGVITVRQQLQRYGGRIVYSAPKSEKGRRPIPLRPHLAAALRTHQARQRVERLAAEEWPEPDLVFRAASGRPLWATYVSFLFRRLLDAAELPQVRVHDIRHSFASVMLQADVPIKVVSTLLGHSTTAITADVYSHLLPGVAASAMDRFDAAVERASPVRNAPPNAAPSGTEG